MTIAVCSKCDFLILPATSSEHAAATVSCKPTKRIKRKMLAREVDVALAFRGKRIPWSRPLTKPTYRQDGLSQ